MILTPSAMRYIGGIYEQAIDRGLNVEAIRLELASRGIARSPAMVKHELDNVFSFHGYADSHQPAPAPSVQAFDLAIDRGRA